MSDFATPWTIAFQTPLSMEFSWQENWSGWPFPSPGDLPIPGIKSRSPTLQVDSLPSEPPGKPKNTWVGSLSLFQGIFPAQKWKRGLLHCRWILYQLSYQGGFVKAVYKWSTGFAQKMFSNPVESQKLLNFWGHKPQEYIMYSSQYFHPSVY